jgi:hypothetical protein
MAFLWAAGTFKSIKALASRAIVPDSPILERRRAELRVREREDAAQAHRLRLAAIRGEFAEVALIYSKYSSILRQIYSSS